MSSEPQISSAYTRAARLSDVLALLQVLALSKNAARSEGGLRGTLGVGPASAPSWTELAGEHPELFRVSGGREPSVALIARFSLSPANEKGARPILDEALLGRLSAMSIEMADRALEREARARWEERQREEIKQAEARLTEDRLAEAQNRRKEREAEYAARAAEESKLRQTTRVALIWAGSAVGIASLAVFAKAVFGS